MTTINNKNIPEFVIKRFQEHNENKKLVFIDSPKTKSKIIAREDFESKPTGYGMFIYNKQSIYIGDIVDMVRQGTAIRTYGLKVDLYYKGSYENHEKKGKGKLIKISTGDLVYDGDWDHDVKHGHGILYNDAGIYEGEFKEDFFDGKGKMKWKNGDVYEGDFKEGRREGHGLMTFANGD